MKIKIITLSLVVFLCSCELIAANLPGPRVYVVTPSTNPRIHEGRSAPQPFYYHNWMRRMDSPTTTTSTTTMAPKKVLTPDLIFAEFESDKMKNIRKLLEKERIDTKQMTTTTTSTSKPIYVPDENSQEQQTVNNNNVQPEKEEVKDKDMTDYFALYNNMYNHNNAPPAPVYLPTTPNPTTTTKKTTSTTTPVPVHNMKNIWDIIDSQKQNQYSGQWDEVPIGSESDKSMDEGLKNPEEENLTESEKDNEEPEMNDHFSLPGFGTKPDIGGENESRAIRTEPNIRFPYVNLKPFQMKNSKKPQLNVFSNSKKSNNMFTNLDNFVEVKHPVRGEVHDVPMRQPIDRYNPAQPYLPSEYGSKSKQSTLSSSQTKSVSNLVPPPPPPPPKITDNDFPVPSTYEQFPPFAPSGPQSAPAPALLPPVQPPSMESDDSDSNTGPGDDNSGDDAPMMDLGYRYKPPSAPKQNFLPTLPPLQKPGYSYDKPPMTSYDVPPMMTVEAPPSDSDFQGYNYDKPSVPDYSGYHYKKPEVPAAAPPPPVSYGHHDSHDYPELIYSKPHAPKGGDDMKGENDMKGGDDSMGMLPPPMADTKPGEPDDSGFPHDFPDFKYPHDFDDHDFHHYHHHHTTTTTTTTEMPRVNRYSYYYLGKKLYYLPLYFSVYFIVYVGALIIKAVLRHKIVYPNSWRPNDQTASFFAKRSVDSPWDTNENLHEITGRVTRAIANVAERYLENRKKKN